MLAITKSSRKIGLVALHLLAGLSAIYLYSQLSEFYVYLFGDTFSSASKLLASTLSLSLSLALLFTVNCLVFRLKTQSLGFSISVIMFLGLYVVGPGIRAPLTIYISWVSFPYNINMLLILLLPYGAGRLLKL